MSFHSHNFTLQLAADGLAAGFLDLGLQPGDTIAALVPVDDADLVSGGMEGKNR